MTQLFKFPISIMVGKKATEKITFHLSLKASIIRLLFISFFLILALVSRGQSLWREVPPAYFLDSIYYVKLPMFDLDKIESINILKANTYDEIPNTLGRVYINIKKSEKRFVFLTLEQIAQRFAKSEGPFLYMINNAIVEDIQDVKVDSSYILNCKVLRSNEISHLQKSCSFTIVNIMTRNKANLEEQKVIRIRGIRESDLQENSY